jgi:hypothetical protein
MVRADIIRRLTSMTRSLLLASTLLAASLVASAATAQGEKLPPTPIDPARLSAIDKVLSADDFEGRGPGTRAEPKVIDRPAARGRGRRLAAKRAHAALRTDRTLELHHGRGR